MNAFFDDYINSKTTLKQFVDQYDNALRRKIENELAANFSSFHTQISCITFYGIERQFQAAYTNVKFKEVQEELRGLIYCCASMIRSERGMFTYHVTDEIQVMDGFRKSTKYVVEFNEEEWRKDMKRDYTLVRSSRDNLIHSPNAHRINKLNNAFYEISSIPGTSDEGCAKLITQLSKLNLEWVEVQPVCDNHSIESLRVTKGSDKLKSPVAARSKGRPISKRKQSMVEKAVNRLKARKTQRAQQNRCINRIAVGDFGSPSLAERDFPITSTAQSTVDEILHDENVVILQFCVYVLVNWEMKAAKGKEL
ncbi:uncharacterized protein LOC122278597 [Carya illinoinensis]|uniref:uncharacterized protein LOC122278597 n=1 Tax=Carya illinoinensis TaxID=32201 RepID=UPI001C71AF5C|nr:uncharacterized protein LOC122278597 [Carya illinoinensis]